MRKYATVEMERAYNELASIEREYISHVLKNDWYNAVQSMWEFIDSLKFYKNVMPEEDVKRKTRMSTEILDEIATKHWQESSSAFYDIFSDYPENQMPYEDDLPADIVAHGTYLKTRKIKNHIAMVFEYDGEKIALMFA